MNAQFFSDGLVNIASGIGTTADKRSSAFYSFCKLPWHAIEARYRSSWIARKVIDLPAAEMTRPQRLWQADGTDTTRLEELERELGVWDKLEEALKLGRMGGGLMVLGVAQGNVDQPLPASLRADSLKYLHVMCRDDVILGDIDRDPGSETFGQPAYFEIVGDARMVRLHPSRVIPFKGRYVPRRNANDEEAFWGDSELDAIDEAIRNADTAQAGFAALIDEAKVDVWGIPDLTTAFINDEAEAALIKRFTVSNTLKSIHNAVIKDAADEWETRELNLSGMPELMLTYLAIVAGAASMPATVLLGKSPDGMNATGDGDLQNWERTLDGWRESKLRPALNKLDSVLMPAAGVTSGDVWWDFGPLREETDNDRADTLDKKLKSVTTMINAGAPPEPILKSAGNVMVESGLYPGLDQLMDEYEADLEELYEPDISEEEAMLPPDEEEWDGEFDDDAIPFFDAPRKGGKELSAEEEGAKFAAIAKWKAMTPSQRSAAAKERTSGRKRVKKGGEGAGQFVGNNHRVKAKGERAGARQPGKAEPSTPKRMSKGQIEKASHQGARVKTSERESEALNAYAGAGFRDINGPLRQGKKIRGEDAKDLEQMDSVFSRASSETDMVVYRGVDIDGASKLSVGTTFRDKGFASTSTSRDGALNFVRGDGSALMEIRVPKGSKAVSMMEHSVFSKTEREILLNRGGTYKVIDFKPGTRTKPPVFLVEYSNGKP